MITIYVLIKGKIHNAEIVSYHIENKKWTEFCQESKSKLYPIENFSFIEKNNKKSFFTL